MKQLTLPGTELSVSVLGFGASNLGTGAKGEEAARLVADYFAAGGNFLDTAHCYAFWEKDGIGASERATGAALRQLGILDKIVIATKGGHPEGGPGYQRPTNYLAENVLFADIENSLFRLGVDCIDLYYLHRDDGRTPVGELIERLNGFIRRGWIRYIAASNWPVERIAAANAYAAEKGLQGFVASQVQWGLATPNWPITETEPTNRYVTDAELMFHTATNLPIVAYSATVSGYFSGNPNADSQYDNPTNQKRRERARTLAAELGATPTQVAVAYLLCQPIPVIPLFSTNKRDHLAEILGSTSVSLTPEQQRWLKEG